MDIIHSAPGMLGGNEDDSGGNDGPLAEFLAVVEAIGTMVFNTVNSRWLSASDITQALVDTFADLDKALVQHDEIRLTVVASQLMANGQELPVKSIAGRSLITHLPRLGINSLTLLRGLDSEEYTHLVDLMCEDLVTLEEMGGFIKVFGTKDFLHVAVKRIQLKEVTEDEAVISRKELETISAEKQQKAESDVLAFFAGEPEKENAQETSESLRQVAGDSQRMASLIVEAVETDASDKTGDDRDKVKEIVSCLKKAFDSLMNDPSSKTKKGKKAIAKTFKELEAALLKKLGAEVDEEDALAVNGAFEQMQETLKVDSIADDYTKRLKALAESERRILRFIKSQGLESIRNRELEGKLNDGGLDVSGWHRLLARSSSPTFGWDIEESTQETANAVGRLAILLGRMETDATGLEQRKTVKTPQKLVEDLTEVRHEMKDSVAVTEKKIQSLTEAVTADEKTIDALEKEAEESGKTLKLTRKKLLTILAEVVQELCQPLSVINCSLGMVTQKTLGDITPAQTDMLNLAAESATKIKVLVDHLEGIVGLPTDLSPDANIQDSLYGRS